MRRLRSVVGSVLSTLMTVFVYEWLSSHTALPWWAAGLVGIVAGLGVYILVTYGEKMEDKEPW